MMILLYGLPSAANRAHCDPSQASTPPVRWHWQSRKASLAGYLEYLRGWLHSYRKGFSDRRKCRALCGNVYQSFLVFQTQADTCDTPRMCMCLLIWQWPVRSPVTYLRFFLDNSIRDFDCNLLMGFSWASWKEAHETSRLPHASGLLLSNIGSLPEDTVHNGESDCAG